MAQKHTETTVHYTVRVTEHWLNPNRTLYVSSVKGEVINYTASASKAKKIKDQDDAEKIAKTVEKRNGYCRVLVARVETTVSTTDVYMVANS